MMHACSCLHFPNIVCKNWMLSRVTLGRVAPKTLLILLHASDIEAAFEETGVSSDSYFHVFLVKGWSIVSSQNNNS